MVDPFGARDDLDHAAGRQMFEGDHGARQHGAALVGDHSGEGGGGFLGEGGGGVRVNRTKEQHRAKHQRRINILRPQGYRMFTPLLP